MWNSFIVSLFKTHLITTKSSKIQAIFCAQTGEQFDEWFPPGWDLTERTGQKFASRRQVEETKLHYLSLCEIPVFQFNAILMQLFPLTIDRPTKHADAFVSEHTCRFL